ncbi:barstar family protein [Candidatus Nitrotoga sp. M5]|uniref:barstar family protein n=1 Tax=Candidatus Nitrotoga sp. M5 TaxID=2890409 RepID=UPI001F93E8C6|nr:hypothetical protein NTGM5_720014 [Candidatus Nitrotoga sp. M5]
MRREPLPNFRCIIDLAKADGKKKFIAAIAQAIRVTDWFGGNWDALDDILSDFSRELLSVMCCFCVRIMACSG